MDQSTVLAALSLLRVVLLPLLLLRGCLFLPRIAGRRDGLGRGSPGQ